MVIEHVCIEASTRPKPDLLYMPASLENQFEHISSLVQILAGNARKVSAIRFERVNNEEALLDATTVTPMVPKIMKKWSKDEESNNGNHNEDTFENKQEDNLLDDHYVIADHKEDNESSNGQ